MKKIIEDQSKNSRDAFDFICMPYRYFGDAGDKICLYVALAGEYTALLSDVQAEVTQFFDMKLALLEKVLDQGLSSTEFVFTSSIPQMAQHILHALQGALIIKRATGQLEHIENTIEIIKQYINY